MKEIILLYAVCILFMPGCSERVVDSNYSSSVILTVSGNEFNASEKLTFTINNNTDSVIFCSYCGLNLILEIEKKENENWGPYSSTVCLAIYAIQNLPIGSKEKSVDSVYVRDPGTYRIKLKFSNRQDSNPVEEVYSNEFTIVK